MSYVKDFEAELLKKLQSSEDPASIVRWASEKIVASYRNGLAAGRKVTPAARKGQNGSNAVPEKTL